jgi:hypothetical protein
MTTQKITWQGKIISVQPRIKLLRSFDQSSHTYIGYLLLIQGTITDKQEEFLVAVGKGAHKKHLFCIGDIVSGESHPVENKQVERADLYKTSKLKILKRGTLEETSPPPWICTAPDLETYRARGHRRLAARTYETKCFTCIWGCCMPVEMIIDHWNPDVKKYRVETFCYGPKSCKYYKAGPTRKVPGRKGMTYEEEDWIDEEATSHRGWDE